MMKTLVVCMLLVLISFGFSSCKKCYTCDFGIEGTAEYCSEDFPDKTPGLMMTIEAYEEQGYKCTEK